ncbi:hypothetical protein ACG3SL_14985 [Sphingomonas sp. CJ20]
MNRAYYLLPLALPLLSAAPLQNAGYTRQCIPQSLVAAPIARDDGSVFFRGQPDARRSYVAVFKGGRCPGINRFATIVIETTGAGYCEGDKLRAAIAPTAIPGPICILDHLEPVTEASGD